MLVQFVKTWARTPRLGITNRGVPYLTQTTTHGTLSGCLGRLICGEIVRRRRSEGLRGGWKCAMQVGIIAVDVTSHAARQLDFLDSKQIVRAHAHQN